MFVTHLRVGLADDTNFLQPTHCARTFQFRGTTSRVFSPTNDDRRRFHRTMLQSVISISSLLPSLPSANAARHSQQRACSFAPTRRWRRYGCQSAPMFGLLELLKGMSGYLLIGKRGYDKFNWHI